MRKEGVTRCSWAALLVLMGVASMAVGGVNAACPIECVCKWKGGKQSVECVNKGLKTIPQGIDHGTQVLDINGNALIILSHEKFKVMGLTNLQRIYVSRCQLRQLDDVAFRGLTNLVELDLSHNELPLVPAAALEHVPGLMRLQISHNPITKIKNGAFRMLRYLTTLEMTSCTIRTVEPRAFEGLEKLEWLKLDNNKLKTVPLTALPNSLHGIDIHNNPWHCDCNMNGLRSWLIQYKVPSSIEPKCVTPSRLEGHMIRDIHTFDLACAPIVRPTSLYIDVMEGKNVSFECHVTAVPNASVFWKFNEQTLDNISFVYDESSAFYIFDEVGGENEIISHLRIEWVTDSQAGVFQCVAENLAGRAVSNFTLRISHPPVVEQKQEAVIDHLLYIGIALIALVLLVIILLCVLIIRCCRRRSAAREKIGCAPGVSGNGRAKDAPPTTTNNMPKYIQMGTPAPKVNGVSSDPPPISVIDTSPFRSESPGSQQTNPDLISDAADERGKSVRKRVSMMGVEDVDSCGTRTTRKLDDIIEEFEEGYDQAYDHPPPPLPQGTQDTHTNRPNPFCTLPRRRDSDIANPYPLTEIPPPEDMNQDPRFYDKDGYPVDFGLPRNGTSGVAPWKEGGAGNGHCSTAYKPLPTEDIPLYATVRRNRHSMPARTDLLHDQKYPEEYHLHNPHNPHMQPLPDGRYPQAYGLTPDKYPQHSVSCEFCPQSTEFTHGVDQSSRINGDGCSSFDNLLSSCGGGSRQCCYTEQTTRVYDNSLPDNYRPIEPKPPPPEGWGDNDQQTDGGWGDNDQQTDGGWGDNEQQTDGGWGGNNEQTDGVQRWCENPESPATRVLYSPDDTYANQPPPQGTQV